MIQIISQRFCHKRLCEPAVIKTLLTAPETWSKILESAQLKWPKSFQRDTDAFPSGAVSSISTWIGERRRSSEFCLKQLFLVLEPLQLCRVRFPSSCRRGFFPSSGSVLIPGMYGCAHTTQYL
ncbi:Hypothetical_protein [Hexamita inflata]|uniref:Hypothetical_protein n=1 Tax=Hexamita inflata TaxID=28002 RepID=A0AA86TYS4_9EUKA|nr:Hypothetical protein HINF_LOCUS22485 [Hexamita inflata]